MSPTVTAASHVFKDKSYLYWTPEPNALPVVISLLQRPPDAKSGTAYRFEAFGRIREERGGSEETFFSKSYADERDSHKRNSHCVYYADLRGQGRYGLVDYWLFDPVSQRVFALMTAFETPHTFVQQHPFMKFVFYFPKGLVAPSVLVPLESVRHKCIFVNVPTARVNNFDTYLFTHAVYRQLNPFDDERDAEGAEVLQEELM